MSTPRLFHVYVYRHVYDNTRGGKSYFTLTYTRYLVQAEPGADCAAG